MRALAIALLIWAGLSAQADPQWAGAVTLPGNLQPTDGTLMAVLAIAGVRALLTFNRRSRRLPAERIP